MRLLSIPVEYLAEAIVILCELENETVIIEVLKGLPGDHRVVDADVSPVIAGLQVDDIECVQVQILLVYYMISPTFEIVTIA